VSLVSSLPSDIEWLRFSLDSEEDGDDAHVQPAKKRKSTDDIELHESPAPKKTTTRKISSSMKPAKKVPPKKVPPKKAVETTDDEDSVYEKPPARAPRRQLAKAAKTYIELSSDDEDNTDGSIFED